MITAFSDRNDDGSVDVFIGLNAFECEKMSEGRQLEVRSDLGVLGRINLRMAVSDDDERFVEELKCAGLLHPEAELKYSGMADGVQAGLKEIEDRHVEEAE